MAFALLVDGRVQVERKNDGGRAVDGHGNRRRRVAQIKPRIQPFGIVDGRDVDPSVTDLAVDIWAQVRVSTVEGHRVKRG